MTTEEIKIGDRVLVTDSFKCPKYDGVVVAKTEYHYKICREGFIFNEYEWRGHGLVHLITQ